MHPIKWLKLKYLRMQEKQDWRIWMFSKESMSSKLISNDPKCFFKIHGGDLGRITTHTFIGEVGNFIGFKFWGYYFVFLFSCLFCFCFGDLFCFGFLLRLKIFVYFPLSFFFWMLIYLHMMLSWVHLILLCFVQV